MLKAISPQRSPLLLLAVMITTNNHLTLLKGYRLTLNKIKCFGFTAYLKGCSSVRALKALVVIVDIPSHYDDPNELSDVILQSVVHSTPPSYSIDITAFDCVLVSLFSHCIPLVNTPQAGSLETKAASVFTIRGKITHTTHNGKKTLLSEVYKGSDAWTLGYAIQSQLWRQYLTLRTCYIDADFTMRPSQAI